MRIDLDIPDGHQVDDAPSLVATFVDEFGAPVTVALGDVTFTIKPPSSAAVTKTNTDLTLVSQGVVSYKYPITESGRHEIKAVWASGGNQAASHAFLNVDLDYTA